LDFKSCGTFDDTPVPPVLYPQRNEKGRWAVGDLELDSNEDKEYINSLIEFREFMTESEEFNKRKAAELAAVKENSSSCVGNNAVVAGSNNNRSP
jgi:hypothetical protein